MKKIFGLLFTRNESDIIESYFRYNLTYLDGVLVYENNRSSDNTREIILKLIDEGLPIYFIDELAEASETDLMGAQHEAVHMAIDKYGADLVVQLDTDEFLYHADGINPRETLEALRQEVEYQAMWRTYVYEGEPDINLGFMPNNFTRYRNPRLEVAGGHAGKTLASRFLMKEKQAKFTSGAHWLLYPEEEKESVVIKKMEKLVCAHFPVRSKSQVMKQVISNSIWKMKKYKNTVPFAQCFQNYQLGILFKELGDNGGISADRMAKNSIEYSLYTLGNREEISKLMLELGDRLTIQDPLNTSFCKDKIGLLYTDYSEMDDNKAFIRATLKEIDSTVMFLSSESNEKSRLLHESNMQLNEYVKHNDALTVQAETLNHSNSALTQQVDALTQQVETLTQQSSALTQQVNSLVQHNDALTQQSALMMQHNGTLAQHNDTLTQLNSLFTQQNNESMQQINTLTQQVSDIYNSRTWKIGKKLQRAYRLFISDKG